MIAPVDANIASISAIGAGSSTSIGIYRMLEGRYRHRGQAVMLQGGAIYQSRFVTGTTRILPALVVRQHSWQGHGYRGAFVSLSQRANATRPRAGANFLKNEDDQCTNTSHLLKKYRDCYVGILIG